MNNRNFAFRGLMAPVFTPFDQQKNVNFNIIPQYAEYLHSSGIQGILVNGTTGEGVSLTAKERMLVLENWIKASEPYGQTIMVQVGGTNMKEVKILARHAGILKASAILCLADLFFRPSNVDELLHYLKIVAAEAPETPLLYYHIPSFTGINLNMKELLERSSEIPTFVGIKFTDKNLQAGSLCVSGTLKGRAVFLGCDELFLSALDRGFDSAIGTTVNMFPTHNSQILRYFKENKRAQADIEQNNLNHNIKQIMKYGDDKCPGSWVSTMKAAMRKLTPIDVGPVRAPLRDVHLENAIFELHY